ncbi:MAG: putative porin [Muribaculaceae bacterium]|nr:putative porin [Muribaculaceae bacterium]
MEKFLTILSYHLRRVVALSLLLTVACAYAVAQEAANVTQEPAGEAQDVASEAAAGEENGPVAAGPAQRRGTPPASDAVAALARDSKGPYAWRLIAPLGLREPAAIDTLPDNYYRRSIPSFVSDAWATTGNLGAEGMNMIFHERPAMSNFFFRDALLHWMPTHDNMRFYNTRIPMTLLSFNTGGGRDNAQERLQGVFSGNINARAQIGARIDYLYSKGSYNNQAAKDLCWGFSGSYMGDRYEMQAYYNHFNLLNKENGGITDRLYILDPAEIQGGVSKIDAKAIPTNLSSAHTRLWGEELYINNRYKVGYWHEEQKDDTTLVRTYIPMMSFIYTLKFNTDKHLFADDNRSDMRDFFEHTYLDPERTHSKTTTWTLSNTFGISLLEGFHPRAKFGLAAYVTHELRRYNMPADTLDRNDATLALDPFPVGIGDLKPRETRQAAWVGAQLTKQRGSLLTYQATAQLGFAGDVAGDVHVDGHLSTRFHLLSDSLALTAFGSFDNREAPYLTNHYISNHFIWQNDFGKRRTVEFGGKLDLARTDTHFRAGMTNVQNHIYFGSDGLPRQYGGSVQVLSLSLQQNLRLGILHWDNRLTYQTTSKSDIIPLPQLAVYSNLYLLCRIATLRLQFGIDCDYYTSYYAPSYQPATVSFVNQSDIKVGNYPFCNVYANMKLSRARFYVLYSHFNKGLFGGNNYFSLPYYPLNPARFQLGISVDFAN